MMKQLLIFSGILFLLAGCSPKEEEQVNQTDEKGLKQGAWRYYHESGELMKTVYYEDDRLHGPEVRFYPNGEKNLEMFWEGDSLGIYLQGEYRHYYDNGQVLHEMHYTDGIPEGPVRYYHRSRKPQIEGQYVQGMKTGTWKHYDSAGVLLKDVDYTNYEQEWNEDFKAGIHTFYAPDGRIYYTATYVGDQVVEDLVVDEELYQKYGVEE